MVSLGILFACANVWFTAARSTIPIAISGTVTQKHRLIEKIPGIDDVYLVSLSSGRRIQIDGHMYHLVSRGQTLEKSAWDSHVRIEGRVFQLVWSRDLRGMALAMPLTITICLVVGVTAVCSGRGGDQDSVNHIK